MPTSYSPRGDATLINRKAESVYGSAPAGNWSPTLILKHSLEEKQPLAEDPTLGQTRQNDRDPLAPAPGLATLSGDIDYPMDLAHLGFGLTDAFGAPVITGTTPNYVHTFKSGLEVLSSMGMEDKLNTALFYQYLGLYATKLSLAASVAEGYDMMSVSYFGRIENKLTVSGAGTPAALPTRIPVPKALCVVKIDGTAVGSLTECKVDYTNGIKPQVFIGDGRAQGGDLDDIASCKGSVAFRFRDSTQYDLAKPQSPAFVQGTHSLELLWQINTNRLFSFLMPLVRLEVAGVPLPGPGGVTWQTNFRAEQDGTNPMVTATLKTATATF